MFVNSITLKELSNKMFHVYTSKDLDMTGYAEFFNWLMDKHNFRYIPEKSLLTELLCELGNDSVEDLFLDKINRMDISEKIFYDIAFELIEPMKVDCTFPDAPRANILIPNY